MLVKTLEIGWHEAKPIYSCDFQRKTTKTSTGSIAHKFATAGADTHVRLWLIHATDPAASGATDKGPKAEYLSTLSKHSGAVNVVRWSPNGERLASAADDGMLIVWAKDINSQSSVWGRDATEVSLDKETWMTHLTMRVTTREVYDLAWSPTGEYILTGSTDNVARIFSATDSTCIREIADHSHYVQGVAWDPMNEYIATQSSDRSVKVYSIAHKHNGAFEIHPVGSNTRMILRGNRTHSRSGSSAGKGGSVNTNAGAGAGTGSHSRAPSLTRPSPRMADSSGRGRGHVRRSSISSEASSVSMVPSHSGRGDVAMSQNNNMDAPLTPATSVASGFGGMFLPPSSAASSSGGPRDSSITPIKEFREPRTAATSRRSSFSGSQAPGSPASFRGRALDDRDSRSHFGRSPSPMPPLPAIRTPQKANAGSSGPATSWISARLYGDENVTSFFRRLTFSPDGNLLYTPAGWFEDNSVSASAGGPKEDEPAAGTESSSCVYVYSKANFSKAPIAAYPGHRRAVVCVKFSNTLFELRAGVLPSAEPAQDAPINIVLEAGKEDVVDVFGSTTAVTRTTGTSSGGFTSTKSRNERTLPSPALSAVDGSADAHSNRTPSEIPPPATVFNLPYRMMFAVATQDTVAIHDTQQATPVCLLSKLHYDSFTDMSWSHDGRVLMLASSDGYCTVVVFNEDMPVYPTQQRDLQLKSVALAHSHPHFSPHGSSQSQSMNPGSMPSQHSLNSIPASSAHGSGLGPQSPLVHPPPSPFVPPHYAPSPAVSVKDLPGPSGSSSAAGTMPATLKRSASTFDMPLTPAASVIGVDGEAFGAVASGATAGGSESERDKERAEGPAKKRRRVELKHHGAV